MRWPFAEEPLWSGDRENLPFAQYGFGGSILRRLFVEIRRKGLQKNQAFRSQSEPTARDLLSDLLACVAGDTLPERVVLAARTNLTICHCERSL